MDGGLSNRRGIASLAVDRQRPQGGDLGNDLQPFGPGAMRDRGIYLLGHVAGLSGSDRTAPAASAAHPGSLPYSQEFRRGDQSDPAGGEPRDGARRVDAPA